VVLENGGLNMCTAKSTKQSHFICRGHFKDDYILTVLTELNYLKEYASLPLDDTKEPDNDVPVCVRRDLRLIQQIVKFINRGRIQDAL
jgi:hypothetical protein